MKAFKLSELIGFQTQHIYKRLFLAVILPFIVIGALIGIIYELFTGSGWINIQVQWLGTLLILIIGIILSPYWAGTGFYGHLLLPWYTYVITGFAYCYTFRWTDYSTLKFSGLTYYKVSGGWISAFRLATNQLTDYDFILK